MPFDTQERILAFTPEALANAETLAAAHGEELNGVHTLLAWRDRVGSDDLRPARLGVDFKPLPTTDGRYWAKGFWTTQAIAAIPDVDGTEELTLTQLGMIETSPPVFL